MYECECASARVVSKSVDGEVQVGRLLILIPGVSGREINKKIKFKCADHRVFILFCVRARIVDICKIINMNNLVNQGCYYYVFNQNKQSCAYVIMRGVLILIWSIWYTCLGLTNFC